MKYILINTNEPKPFEENSRLGRVGHIYETLTDRESQVVWITSNYSHTLKRYLKSSEKISPDGVKIKYLLGLPYKKNISIIRILNNIFLGIQVFIYLLIFAKESRVLTSCPLIETTFAATLCSSLKKLNIMIDIRDDWPDSFIDHIPYPFKFSERLILFPWRAMLKYSFSRSIKIIAMSSEQASFGKKYSDGKAIDIFYIGDDIPKIMLSDRTEEIRLFFIGTLSPARPLDKLIKSLDRTKLNLHLNIVGDGDEFEKYKSIKSEIKVTMHGRKVGHELHNLIKDADILLAPFAENYGFSLPTKIATYIGYGVPVITNIARETGEFLNNYDLGSVVNFDEFKELKSSIIYWHSVNRIEHYEKSRKVYADNFNIINISKSIVHALKNI